MVAFKKLDDFPGRVTVIKTGPVIAVTIGGKEVIKYVDDFPVYSDYSRFNRLFLQSSRSEKFSKITISTEPSAYDYEKVIEFRTPVRFKKDLYNYYEMQIIPGLYVDRIRNILIMREMTEIRRAEERMAAYKKERDRAMLRLASKEKGFHGLIGISPLLENVVSTIKTVAKTKTTILITGETGTGKDLAAKAVHIESCRRGAFVKVDCASLPMTLIESELFVHEKGAFTGADSRKTGKFEQAHGGTLFLDEIGNLSSDLQMKLLRFIQDRKFERLGGKETMNADVRIIAATNIDLAEAVEQGRFRSDLYFRLNVIHINMPPLRERLTDIYPIVNSLIVALSEDNEVPIPDIHNDVFPALMNYDWPGNIRELKNAIESAIVINQTGQLKPEHFPGLKRKKISGKSGKQQKSTGKAPVDYNDDTVFTRAFNDLSGKPRKLANYFECSYDTVRKRILELELTGSISDRIGSLIRSFSGKEFTISQIVEGLNISRTTAIKYIHDMHGSERLSREVRNRKVYYRELPGQQDKLKGARQ
jgi:transcriptional regulator with PAS, ATPase and Fis domain